ncbi:restriction endonuclease subunit S [Rhodopirellula europaea]|uniref:restriction endonuclease subunit S n=1 Tax=Rhodopirellula europaea TaxID=1263866 RepID=UPI00034CB3FD|nr:restriction endonuclease subunit S [Rhodopirellula europaea]
MNARFLNWAFQANYARSFFATRANGLTRYGLGAQALGEWDVPIPSEDEQKQIASFLDNETAKIDALIEKQQQLIALLGEKRQAVISHAVTKGLNPDAPMRDSGVEWLGEVPSHWTVCRLKHAFSFLTSGPRGWSDLITDNGTSVFLQSGDLNDELGLRLDTAKRITPPTNAEGVRTKMQDGDVVCCVTGANTGRVAVATKLNQTVFVNQHLALIRPRHDLAHPRFLATLLAATPTRTYFAVKQYGLKEGLSLTNVAETPICLPPVSEQEDIVNYLDKTESKMRRLREIADDQVELLQERRTALISAAVTGKIDVRGWKRPSAAPKKETEMEVA